MNKGERRGWSGTYNHIAAHRRSSIHLRRSITYNCVVLSGRAIYSSRIRARSSRSRKRSLTCARALTNVTSSPSPAIFALTPTRSQIRKTASLRDRCIGPRCSLEYVTSTGRLRTSRSSEPWGAGTSSRAYWNTEVRTGLGEGWDEKER